MARGELLRKLFLTHNRDDDMKFRAVAMQIIAEEQQKNNNQLAKDLLRILDSEMQPLTKPSKVPNIHSMIPQDKEQQAGLVDIRTPEKGIKDILLTPKIEKHIGRVITEYRKSELLHLHGLKPKTKLLFCGPPGCGKTLCANVIAHELGLPVLYVNFDSVVSSYLGETASNLRKIFDHARSGRWVLFFDEFDAIGKARDDSSEHGELKRVVNSFLQLLDNFDEPSLVIAATNHEGMLDPALWRRFDEIVYFGRPTVHDIRKLLGRKLQNFPNKGINIRAQASRMKGMSHAAIERVCIDAIKMCIISDKDYLDQDIFNDSVQNEKERAAIVNSVVMDSATV